MMVILQALVVAFTMGNIWTSAQHFTVHSCKNRQLQLSCRIGLIEVAAVVLGDSRCSLRRCCPRDNDCRGPPSHTYRDLVHGSCNRQKSCSVHAEISNIGCGLLPNNDYVNITYRCIVIEDLLSTSSRYSTTGFPTSLSRSSIPHLAFTNATSQPDIKTTEAEKEEIVMTSSPVKGSTELNLMHLQKSDDIPKQAAAREIHSADRITVLLSLAVIVAGVVITTAVISCAVVIAKRKRRIMKTDETYDMPCNAPNDEIARNSNFYDTIPDFRACATSQSANVDCTAKENEYLTPVNESEESPYLWVS